GCLSGQVSKTGCGQGALNGAANYAVYAAVQYMLQSQQTGPTLSHPGDGATAFVGGFFDYAIRGPVYSAYTQYIQDSPSLGAAYFTWDQRSALASWIDANGGAVTVVGHSWGAATAATVVAAGHQVESLITVDPVSWLRPDYVAVAANAGT